MSEVEQIAYRDWQREDEAEKHSQHSNSSGYSQQAAAGLLLEKREREDRLEHPGRGGLAACAVLLDLEHALERDEHGRSVRVPEWVQARAGEWIDGIGFDRTIDPAKLSLTAWEPQLVESIPDLQQAIRDAHDSDAHLVQWDGQWTTIDALYRMLDDTRTVRRISGAMSRKKSRVILTGVGAARGFCAVCGARRDTGRAWRDLDRDLMWCQEHGQAPQVVVQTF